MGHFGGVRGICLHFPRCGKLRFGSVQPSPATVHRTVAFRWVRVRYPYKNKQTPQRGICLFGAANRTRTGTSVTSRDFKSLVSTYSTTPAAGRYGIIFFPLRQVNIEHSMWLKYDLWSKIIRLRLPSSVRRFLWVFSLTKEHPLKARNDWQKTDILVK